MTSAARVHCFWEAQSRPLSGSEQSVSTSESWVHVAATGESAEAGDLDGVLMTEEEFEDLERAELETRAEEEKREQQARRKEQSTLIGT